MKKFARNQVMLSLHLLAFLALAIFLFMIVFFTWLPRMDVYEGPPLSRTELVLRAVMLVDILFWMVWLVIAVFSREYFYKGNQWVRCLPVVLLATVLLIPRLICGSKLRAIIHFVSAFVIYLVQSSTTTWRPWSLDTTEVHREAAPLPPFF